MFIISLVFLTVNAYLLANRGQTIGKFVMKTQIVSDGGELVPLMPLFLKRYLLIWFIGSLPFVGRLFSLADALVIFRDNRKCLHDEFAGTKVIRMGG